MKKKEQLFIFDNKDNLLTVTRNYIRADFEEDVTKPISLTIEFPMSDDDAEHLIGGNQVAFRDLRGNFRLFLIREVDDEDGEATEKIVECLPGINELKDVIIEERVPQDKTAEEILQVILENSRWKVGHVDDFGRESTNFYFDKAYKGLETQTKLFGGEIVDRIEVDKNGIAGRYIDHVYRKGQETGKRWEMGKDIKKIVRTHLYYPKTALYGKGKSLETEGGGYSRKITFRNVVWSKSNGDPANKPDGQEWVGDDEAREKYGIYNPDTKEMEHRFDVFEDGDEEEPKELLKKTWLAVQDEKEPEVQYKMDIITFYGISGYEHEQVFLGDSGIARDKTVKPMILVSSRVMKLKYNLGNPKDGEVTIGNILDLSNSNTDIDWVIDKVKDNQGKWDAGGGPITDEKFPDIKPDVPTNVQADGLFRTIMLSWDFESTYLIADYEVYASQIKGFVPDGTTLVFRGKTGGYNFNADTDEKWYFRVRAVNTHGTPSDFSEEVSASTAQLEFGDIEEIVPDFIDYSIYKGDEPPEPKKYKYWINTSKEPVLLYAWNESDGKWVPLAPTDAKDLGAVEIEKYQQEVNEVIQGLAEKANAEWVDGQLKEINEVVEGHGTQIKKNSNEISSKASQNEVNDISGKVSKNESNIRQQAKLIEQKVNATDYKKDKDGIISDLESHETRIKQTEEDITSKVDSTTYKADKESLEKSINENKSSIEQNAEAITSKVDATYVHGAIGDIEVGGRNLLTGTKDELTYVNVSGWADYRDNNTNHHDLVNILQPGETYTLRVFLDARNSDYPVCVRIRLPNETTPYRDFQGNWIEAGKQGYSTVTFVMPNDAISSELLMIRFNQKDTPTQSIGYGKVKLEKGNKATDWTPAPEDTDAEIKSVRDYASEIEQTAEGIKSDVSSIEKDINSQGVKIADNASAIEQNATQISQRVTAKTYNADMNNLTNRVSTAESSIEQHADKIESKVEKNGVRSAIMQSPESIKLSAEVLDIKGHLRVQSGNIYVKDSVITNKMIAGNAAIDFAKIANVKITNAMIQSVSAAKINTGTLDAEKVTVQVKNGTQAIRINDKGFESVDSSGNVRIHIGVRNISGKGQSDPATIRFFGGSGSKSAGVGMNVNNTFVIGSSAKGVAMELRSEENALYRAPLHRFWFTQGPSSNYWEMKYWEDGDGDWHPRLFSNRANGGYVGIKSRKLWRIYVNHLHYNVQHKISNRESKTEIHPLNIPRMKQIFDDIQLRSFRYLKDNGEVDNNISYGVITDETPAELLDEEGDAVIQDNYISVIAGALKYEGHRVDLHDNEIVKLKEKVSSLEERIQELEGVS